jgi:guanylate kinase
LAQRKTESAPEMELRLAMAKEELARVEEFEYRVVNRDDGLDQAIADIDAIITAEKCRTVPRLVQLI